MPVGRGECEAACAGPPTPAVCVHTCLCVRVHAGWTEAQDELREPARGGEGVTWPRDSCLFPLHLCI